VNISKIKMYMNKKIHIIWHIFIKSHFLKVRYSNCNNQYYVFQCFSMYFMQYILRFICNYYVHRSLYKLYSVYIKYLRYMFISTVIRRFDCMVLSSFPARHVYVLLAWLRFNWWITRLLVVVSSSSFSFP